MMIKKAPKITNISWGKIEIDSTQTFKDLKIFPGGFRAWNWQETGTQHYPGIQYSDVKELIENGAEEIVLTRGVFGRLQVPKELTEQLESEGIKVHILKTREAVKLYNDLTKTKQVGALIHTTC